jgi:hypothetical protein
LGLLFGNKLHKKRTVSALTATILKLELAVKLSRTVTGVTIFKCSLFENSAGIAGYQNAAPIRKR